MPIRPMKLPTDMSIMYQLVTDSFQYPEHPEWNIDEDEIEGFKQTVGTLRTIWPLYRLVGLLTPALRDAMLGFIWEEDDKPVGLVNVARRGTTDSWMIGNVSVLPEYRRRGIARKLVEAAVELAQQKGGKLVVLDVISGNLPAYELYKNMGFVHYTSTLDLISKSVDVPPMPSIPDGYVFEKLPLSDWQVRMELSQKLIPVKVQAFDPVEKGRFYIPPAARVFVSLMNRIRKVVDEEWGLWDAKTGQLVAMAMFTAQTRSGDRHFININVSPENADLVPFLLQYLVHRVRQVSTGHAIGTMLWEWRYFTLEEHEILGFTKVKEGHRLGIKL